jgi:hypothetical protein
MVMTEMSGISVDDAACAREGADYKGRENPFKPSVAVQKSASFLQRVRHPDF